MGFSITSDITSAAYEGQIISYKIGILPGLSTSWITEITHINDQKYFVDEQRSGPYSMWHHEHFFEKNESGVMMADKVSYKVPFGIIGRMANRLFIEKQLRSIFTYRFNKLEELFNI
jgi:ligand-binding SRPBCC domain-containing protein